jgi:hypothetical protein
MRRRVLFILATLALSIALALALRFMMGTPAPVSAQDAPLSIANPTYMLLATTDVATGTTYTNSPNFTAGGRDASLTEGYNKGEVFVTIAGLSDDVVVTSTVQFSADGENWSDIAYEYWSGSEVLTTPVFRVFSEDGTQYTQAELMGKYVRVKLESTGEASVSVYATYRR